MSGKLLPSFDEITSHLDLCVVYLAPWHSLPDSCSLALTALRKKANMSVTAKKTTPTTNVTSKALLWISQKLAVEKFVYHVLRSSPPQFPLVMFFFQSKCRFFHVVFATLCVWHWVTAMYVLSPLAAWPGPHSRHLVVLTAAANCI